MTKEDKKERQNAVGYVRVSTKNQADKGNGIHRQISEIKKYTKNHNLNLVKVYCENGCSGTVENRPALTEMMVDLETQDDVNTLVLEKLDRLSRDLLVSEMIVNRLKKKGIDLISCAEGSNLLNDDPSRVLIRRLFSCIAEYDKRILCNKLRLAREKVKREKGKCEGAKGYHEIRQDTLKIIKGLRRKRKGLPRMSYGKIAEQLNAMNITTLSGRQFTTSNVAKILNR